MFHSEQAPGHRLDEIFLRLKSKVKEIIRTITGNLPLIVPEAVASAIRSLTRYGLCTQDGTPTPEAPVDIMCNNGVIGMVDDELPAGYTRLQYIESNGTSDSSDSNGYVDTGILINSIDTDVEIDFQLTDTYAPSPRMVWGYMGTPSSLPRWGFGAYSSKWLGSPNATASAGGLDTDRHVAVMRVYNGGSNSAFYNGTLDGETLYNVNNLSNVSIFEDNDKWSVYLFARNNNNKAANFVPCKIFRFKVTKAGALTHDLVPCKDGNGALGFYDLVTATFSAASGTLIAGAADYSHSHIGAVGTPEVLTVSGANLLNPATNITGKYLDRSGKIKDGADAQYTDLIPVTAGETYMCSLVSGRNSGNNRWHAYDANGGWVKQLAYVSASEQQGNKLSMTATIDSGISYVRLSYGINDTEAMISLLLAASENIAEGFFNGVYPSNICSLPSNYGTIQSPHTSALASRAPALLAKVEPGKTYCIRNKVNGETRRCVAYYASLDDVTDGKKIINYIDGASNDIESTTAPTGAAYVVIGFKSAAADTTYTFGDPDVVEVNTDYQPYVEPQAASVPMLLSVGDVKDEVELISGAYTHRCAACKYDGTQDIGETYLSTTGGKDVGAIIVYPLAEPTTESITPQELTLAEGTNIIDATANVEPLTAECEYQAVSALDILSALLGTRSGTEDMSIKDAKDVVNVILGDDNK